MTKKEIDHIVGLESGMILIEKGSEVNFFEWLLDEAFSILAIFYFLRRNKLDMLVLTEKRVILTMKNKVKFQRELNGNETLTFNGVKTALEIIDRDEKTTIGLTRLRVTYEEGKMIRQQLSEFQKRAK